MAFVSDCQNGKEYEEKTSGRKSRKSYAKDAKNTKDNLKLNFFFASFAPFASGIGFEFTT
ncbi:MAG: hypothetical protein EAZ37_00605 [Burkholderiales bacterium]|nr:MAG: hypothetical protein EAZ37_00605 [Burkholderiales bacterium]